MHPPSRIQTILTSISPITLLVGNEVIAENLSVALRIAHDLHLYHKLDSEIITSLSHYIEANMGPGLQEMWFL